MLKRKLQVFVSSTFTDLISERQAAVSAILKAGHIPAGMELFTAGDRSQMEIIERWIDESDVYMLILGGRYGSVEANSGMGYTELEYDYAASQGKSLFAVVIKEDALEERFKSLGSDAMEKVNPSKLNEFRLKVLSNMSSFFVDEKDIRLAVYESLSDFANNRELKGWVSADSVADANLLQQEIHALREKNSELVSRIAELASKANKVGELVNNVKSQVDEDLDEIESVLRNTDIEMPHSKENEGGNTRSLLNIFYSTRSFFINGITNQAGMKEAAQFLFFNIAPRLQLHGLVDNEKVVGKAYRRVVVSKKGIALLARIEKRSVAAAAEDKAKMVNGPKSAALEEKGAQSKEK
jgi:FtsZ-binding cell division protein ZapB